MLCDVVNSRTAIKIRHTVGLLNAHPTHIIFNFIKEHFFSTNYMLDVMHKEQRFCADNRAFAPTEVFLHGTFFLRQCSLTADYCPFLPYSADHHRRVPPPHIRKKYKKGLRGSKTEKKIEKNGGSRGGSRGGFLFQGDSSTLYYCGGCKTTALPSIIEKQVNKNSENIKRNTVV